MKSVSKSFIGSLVLLLFLVNSAAIASVIPVEGCLYLNGLGDSIINLVGIPDEKSTTLPPNLARQLSYYAVNKDVMLLGPRDWQCEVYEGGSGGWSFGVVPRRAKMSDANKNIVVAMDFINLFGAFGDNELRQKWVDTLNRRQRYIHHRAGDIFEFAFPPKTPDIYGITRPLDSLGYAKMGDDGIVVLTVRLPKKMKALGSQILKAEMDATRRRDQ